MPAAWELIKPVDANGQPIPQRLLAVCIPHTGEVSSEWAMKLREIQFPAGTQLFMSRGMPIDVTRETMVKSALDQGFEWIFFLDSDVILPPNAFENLFSHHLPIINGMYKAKKPGGFFWAVWMKVKTPDNKEAFAPVATWTGRTIECDVIGTGCMLVHRSVFEKIRATYPHIPWFFWAKERSSEILDAMKLPDPLLREVSEDFFFCLLAKKCGYQIIVDTDVKCKHISVVAIGEETVSLPGV
jgi:hypothetical protein